MQIRLDPDVNALYIEFREGDVAKTIEVAEMVYLDVDDQGSALGLEFVNADDFIPFLREQSDSANVPRQLREFIAAPVSS